MKLSAATDVNEEAKTTEFERLVERARHAGIDITMDVITSELATQEIEAPSDGWVHLNHFRLFELRERWYPWMTEEERLTSTDELSGPLRPRWEQQSSTNH